MQPNFGDAAAVTFKILRPAGQVYSQILYELNIYCIFFFARIRQTKNSRPNNQKIDNKKG